jgi:hypothetical protein
LLTWAPVAVGGTRLRPWSTLTTKWCALASRTFRHAPVILKKNEAQERGKAFEIK